MDQNTADQLKIDERNEKYKALRGFSPITKFLFVLTTIVMIGVVIWFAVDIFRKDTQGLRVVPTGPQIEF